MLIHFICWFIAGCLTGIFTMIVWAYSGGNDEAQCCFNCKHAHRIPNNGINDDFRYCSCHENEVVYDNYSCSEWEGSNE